MTAALGRAVWAEASRRSVTHPSHEILIRDGALVAFAGEHLAVFRNEIIDPVAGETGEEGKGVCQRGPYSAERFSKRDDGVAFGEHDTVAFAKDDHGAAAFHSMFPQIELCGEDTLQGRELDGSLRVELIDVANDLAAECTIPIEK